MRLTAGALARLLLLLAAAAVVVPIAVVTKWGILALLGSALPSAWPAQVLVAFVSLTAAFFIAGAGLLVLFGGVAVLDHSLQRFLWRRTLKRLSSLSSEERSSERDFPLSTQSPPESESASDIESPLKQEPRVDEESTWDKEPSSGIGLSPPGESSPRSELSPISDILSHEQLSSERSASTYESFSGLLAAGPSELLTGSPVGTAALLEKAVREVEKALAATGAQSASAAALYTRLACALDRNRYQAQLWQSRGMRAVEAGDDDLGREALAQARGHQRLAAALEEQVEQARHAASARKRQTEVLRLRLAEAKRLLASFRRD